MKNPIAEAQEQVREVLLSAIGRCVAAGTLPPEPIPAFSVEIPADPKNGDFATNAAMVSARAFRMAPRKIAEAIEAELVLAGTYFERAEIAGPGLSTSFWERSGTAPYCAPSMKTARTMAAPISAQAKRCWWNSFPPIRPAQCTSAMPRRRDRRQFGFCPRLGWLRSKA